MFVNVQRLSLVRTSGDRQNLFALSEIRINRCHWVLKSFEGTKNVYLLTGVSY